MTHDQTRSDLIDPAEIAAQLGTSDRWVRIQVRARGIPHLDLGRGRMRLTPEQRDQFLAALTIGNARTERSRPRAGAA